MTPPLRRILHLVAGAAGLALVPAGLTLPAFSQIVMDGKLGAGGALAGPNFDINAGLGRAVGNNLFHSFAQFNLVAGETAKFSGPANIQNILSRVTGGSPSSIDGTIRSDVAGANLFLINPSGIVLGPNAKVDVSGSFALSTASYLKLADGARFVAALDADDSALSTAPVVAFGFLEGATGTVTVQGSLQAGNGSTLSVVGTDVTVLDGTRLEAPNGRIELVGTKVAGEVPFQSPAPAAFQAAKANALAAADQNPGNVVIRGGRLVVDNAKINVSATGGSIDIAVTEGMEVLNGGQVTTANAGDIKGGDILIDAPSLVINGHDGENSTRVAAETFSELPQAGGGNVTVKARTVELLHGAEISVSTYGSADAGIVDITTSALTLEGSDIPIVPTQISANASPFIGGTPGAGGGIVIHADTVQLRNGAGLLAATTGDADAGTIQLNAGSVSLLNSAITTFSAGAGDGGAIQIHADNLTLDGPFASITALTTAVTDPGPAGNGGVIDLTVGALQLLNDAGISATTYGNGNGGNVNIVADSVLLDTATFQPGSIPGITAASNPPFFGEGASGKGGDIRIKAGSLTLRNGMTISATTSTAGDGGSIEIQAAAVALDGTSSIQSATLSTGRAGNISLTASQDAVLTAGGTISTASFETGKAGNIALVAGRDVVLTTGGAITTSAPHSSGGDITVKAGNEIRVTDSQISAKAGLDGGSIKLTAPSLIYLLHGTLTAQADTTESGFGNGGNITIDPVFFIINDSSLISKSSKGNGGNITILSDFFLASASIIDASAPFGLPGTVSVSAPDVDLSGSLVALPGNLLSNETQLRPDCGVRLTGNISSFIVLGRGGMPLEPGGFVPSLLNPSPYADK